MSQRLARVLVVVGVAVVACAAAGWAVRGELKVRAELARTRQTALDLAELHLKASRGELRMLGPETLEMAFIDAGFPPKRPMPSLSPRARLKGGALSDAGRQTVALAHYVAGEGRLTVFTLPAQADIFPEDTALVVRRGLSLQVVKRGEVTLSFWKAGYWMTAVATEMPDGDRDLFIDLVRASQGG